MNQINPYHPPESITSSTQNNPNIELPFRFQRWGGAMLDRIIFLFCSGPIMYVFGATDYANRGQSLPLPLALSQTIMDFIIFAILNGYLIKQYGQTIGKKIVGIKIVNLENEKPSLLRILGLRYLPIYCIGLLPIFGLLPNAGKFLIDADKKLYYAQIVLLVFDILFIFRSDQRCIHDLIAGTKVVMRKNRTENR